MPWQLLHGLTIGNRRFISTLITVRLHCKNDIKWTHIMEYFNTTLNTPSVWIESINRVKVLKYWPRYVKQVFTWFLFFMCIVHYILCVTRVYTLKTGSRHITNFVVSGGTGGCHNENFRCHQCHKVASGGFSVSPMQSLYKLSVLFDLGFVWS